MDPSADLPPGLRAPASGERVAIVWRADLGARRRVGDLAQHLADLDTAISLGERWGTELAKVAAYQQLTNRILREGPHAVVESAMEFGYSPMAVEAIDEWMHTGRWPGFPPSRRSRFPYGDPASLLQTIADMELPRLLGSPLEVENAAYRNPIEIALGGSGLLLGGAIYVLRMLRDWSSTRRLGEARADHAEAEAREQQARARTSEARADLATWLVEQAKESQTPIPISEMIAAVTQADEHALARLAANDVELDAPELGAAP